MKPPSIQQAASAAATPKTTTIERIARAIWERDFRAEFPFPDPTDFHWATAKQARYFAVAQAALQALRQVDEGTVEAMDRDNPVTWPWDYEATCEDRTDTLRAAFTAAIDHILEQDHD